MTDQVEQGTTTTEKKARKPRKATGKDGARISTVTAALRKPLNWKASTPDELAALRDALAAVDAARKERLSDMRKALED
jgi:hypothetical protein